MKKGLFNHIAAIAAAVVLLAGCSRQTAVQTVAPMPTAYRAEAPDVLATRPLAVKEPTNPRQSYRDALAEITDMAQGRRPLSFERAVFLTENAWHADSLSYGDFDGGIQFLASLSRQLIKDAGFDTLKNPAAKNWAIWQAITQPMTLKHDGEQYVKPAFAYDMDDFDGHADWANTFVTRLMATGRGNCRSLPYLYQILADELGAQNWLALAPNHTYIKQYGEPDGYGDRSMVNVELTNGSFPQDAWIMASGYISRNAVANGMYMDTIGGRRLLSLCLVDLAQGYQRKFGSGRFVEDCLQEALACHPRNINARAMLAEVWRGNGQADRADSLAARLVREGYREMPPLMYRMWLTDIRTDKDAYDADGSDNFALPKRLQRISQMTGLPVMTLTQGKFDEFPERNTATNVGSVRIDIATGKVIGLAVRDSVWYSDASLNSRFMSVDPLTKSYPELTPYQFASNTPIQAIDLDGLEKYHYTFAFDKDGNTTITLTNVEHFSEWQWDPGHDGNGITGYHLWNKVKDPRKEYIVEYHFSDFLQVGGAAEPVQSTYSLTYTTEAAALQTTWEDFEWPATKADIAKGFLASWDGDLVGLPRRVGGRPIIFENESPGCPSEPYNRTSHYGKTPTEADRAALGAGPGQDVDHVTPLVKHYYEGDGSGGKPGYQMTPDERKNYAKDRDNMQVVPQGQNRSEGGKLTQYSKQKKKEYGFDKKP